MTHSLVASAASFAKVATDIRNSCGRQKPQGAYRGIGETPTVACLRKIQAMCGSTEPNNKNLHGSKIDRRSLLETAVFYWPGFLVRNPKGDTP